MKLAIASDLHLEHSTLRLENTSGADVLILAGDILNASDLHRHKDLTIESQPEKLGKRQKAAINYRKFIQQVSNEFSKVIVIAGNHEFYDGKWNQTLVTLKGEYEKFANVHFLERDYLEINGVGFVGGTLWTDLNRGDPLTVHAVKDLMNDYKCIVNDDAGYSKLRPSNTLVRHRQTLDYFKFIFKEKQDRKLIAISHMAPSSLSIHDNYRGQYLMNGAYYTELGDLIADNPHVALWVHGHMHHELDYQIEKTRVVCHPRGYVSKTTVDDDDFKCKIIEI
jgi:Icc-related predicted phosphoesterase